MGNEEIASLFLDAGAPVDIPVERRVWLTTYQDGKSAYLADDDLHHSPEETNPPQGLTALHHAALTGSARMTRFLLKHGANPNAVSEYGETPLHMALKQDLHGQKWIPGNRDRWSDPDFRIEVLLDLIDNDPDDEEEFDRTRGIIEKQRLDVLDALLHHPETDMTARDVYSASFLHCIRYEKRASQAILTRLLEKNIAVSVRNLKGQSSLHLACLARDVDSLMALIRRGANARDTDNEGRNALHYAARSGDERTLRIILSLLTVDYVAALTTARDGHDQNALHRLLGRSGGADRDAVRRLLSSGVGVNDLDDGGYSPLAVYLAKSTFQQDKAQVVRLLIQSGADASFTTQGGLGLAHLSAKTGRLDAELLSTLVNFNVDLHLQDAECRTILHHAAMAGSLTEAALDFLCNIGLSTGFRNALSLTPLEYAVIMREKDHHRDTFDRNRWLRTEQILRGHELACTLDPGDELSAAKH